MTSISTLTPTQYRELYGKQAVLSNQPTLVDDAVSILSQNNTQAATGTSSDGADDGKISLGKKIKSIFKGIGKTLVNAVKSLNPLNPKNWWNIIKVAGCVALSIACPPAGVALACVAGVKGAITVGKGAVAASKATTDAEAEAAWENIGSGGFQVGMAVVGARAGLKAMKATPGSAMSKLGKGAGLKNTAQEAWKDIKSFGRGANPASKVGGYKIANLNIARNAGKYAAKGVNFVEKCARHISKDGFINTAKLAGHKASGAIANKIIKMTTKPSAGAASAAGKTSLFKTGMSNWKNAATTAGYKSIFASTKPAIANLLEAANSDDEMARQQAIGQLQQLGYYNVY